jgi:hypothetical protein
VCLSNGRLMAGPNLLVPVRSSTPLHRVSVNLLEVVCEMIAEINIAARFLRWIPTCGQVFGSGGPIRGVTYRGSDSGGVSTARFLPCFLCCSIFVRSNRPKGWKLAPESFKASYDPFLLEWIRYNYGKGLVECIVRHHQLFFHSVG